MASTFLSYSRRDIEFARRLETALKAAGEETWVDWTGIPPTSEFARDIEKGIEASDNFLLVMSPDSLAATSYCVKEIEHAGKMGKRMIPIYFRDVPPAMVPASLAKLNYIYFRETDDFDAAFAKLQSALHTDLAWTSMSSRLLVRAVEWDKQGRDGSFLLRGKDLSEAETWLAQAASKEGHPTELQSGYILESRKSAIRTQRRIRNALIGGLALVLMGAAAAVYEAIAAKRQAAVATSRSLATAALLEKDGDFSLALLLSVEAQKVADTYDSRNAIVTLWQAWAHLVRFESDESRKQQEDHRGEVVKGSGASLIVRWELPGSNGNEGHSVLSRSDGSIVRDPLTGAPVGGFPGGYERSADGKILVASSHQGVQVWTLPDYTPRRILSVPRDPGLHTNEVDLAPQLATFDPLAPGVVAVIDARGRFGYQDPLTGRTRNDVNPARVALINSFLPVRRRPPLERLSNTKRPVTDAERRAEADEETRYRQSLIQQIAFGPRWGEFAFSQGFDVTVIDLNAGKLLTHLNASAVPRYTEDFLFVQSLSFSPDGQFLSAQDSDGQLGVWTVRDSQGVEYGERFDPEEDIAIGYSSHLGHFFDRRATWMPDGSLGSGGALWRPGWPRGTRVLGPVDDDQHVNQGVVQPVFLNASQVVTINGSRKGVVTWKLREGIAQYHDLGFMSFAANDFNFNDIMARDGRTVLSVAYSPSAATAQNHRLNEDESARALVSHLRRWDVEGLRDLPELTDSAIRHPGQLLELTCADANGRGDVAVSLKGGTAGNSNQTATLALLWRSGQSDRAEPIPLGVGEQLKSLAFTPNGKVLAGVVVRGDEAEQGVLRLWSVDRLRALRTVSVEVDYKPTITFSSDGSLLYFAPAVYETRTLRQVALVQRQSAGDLAAFAPGNRQLAIDQDHKVILWDVEARRQLGAAIDAGGPAVGKGGGYDAEGESFSPDGSWMATAYRGHRLELWRNPLVGWPELACSVANRNLTPDEWSLYFGSQPYRKTCPALPAGENIQAN